jgi:hypothetical protein
MVVLDFVLRRVRRRRPDQPGRGGPGVLGGRGLARLTGAELMRRLACVGLAALGACWPVLAVAPAAAATHAPCVRHSAVAPTVATITDGVTVLSGAGDIGGCPAVATTASESVTVTVCLQRLDSAGWVDAACNGPVTKGWNRYWRYARQLGLSVTATCVDGDWRTDVRGGDGWDPTEWASPVVTFAPGDSGVCGSYGGGD